MNDIFLGTKAIRFGKPLGEHGVSARRSKTSQDAPAIWRDGRVTTRVHDLDPASRCCPALQVLDAMARECLSARAALRSRSARLACRSSIAALDAGQQQLRLRDLGRIGVVELQVLGDRLQAEAQVLAAQDQLQPGPVAASSSSARRPGARAGSAPWPRRSGWSVW